MLRSFILKCQMYGSFLYLLLFILFFAWLSYNAIINYYAIHEDHKIPDNIKYVPDKELGFIPKPNSKASLSLFPGNKYLANHNNSGFRIPYYTGQINSPNQADIIFLGCSVTYGFGCNANETFAHLASKELHYNYINAGVCAYGLSQMYILSDELIEKYEPKYMVIQRSPWLVYRALSVFCKSIKQPLISTPYFSFENNELSLIGPQSNSKTFKFLKKLNADKEDDFIDYYLDIGFKYAMHEKYKLLKGYWDVISNEKDMPGSEASLIESIVYDEILRNCIKHNITPIVLNYGYARNYSNKLEIAPDLSNKVIQVSSDSVLMERLHFTMEQDTTENAFYNAYNYKFGHCKKEGSDLIIVDTHPNKKAHKLIANTLISVLMEDDVYLLADNESKLDKIH